MNKPKMVQFCKNQVSICIKIKFYGGQFYKKYQNLVSSKSGKKSLKSVNLEVKNVEKLCIEVWSWKLGTFLFKY